MTFVNKNLLIVGIAALIVVLAGGFFLYSKKGNNSTTTPAPTSQALETSTPIASPSSSASPSGSPEKTVAKTVTINVTSSGYSPATITIDKGTKVVWVNMSGDTTNVSSDPHPIHTDYPALNLGSFPGGASVSLTFDTVGTHGYHNHLNPSEKGTVIVK